MDRKIPSGGAPPQVLDQGVAVHARHLEVGDHHVDRLLGQLLDRVMAVNRGEHIEAAAFSSICPTNLRMLTESSTSRIRERSSPAHSSSRTTGGIAGEVTEASRSRVGSRSRITRPSPEIVAPENGPTPSRRRCRFLSRAGMTKGGTFGKMFAHAVWRSLLLIALGIFFGARCAVPSRISRSKDTLTQIGLGYPFLFLLGFKPPKWQWIAFSAILFGYWLAWALYPVPGPNFDWRAVGVSPDWPHNFTGFAAHWNKNSNLGNAFDQWFLNLFPRVKPFVANGGGYLTLSFIPTLGTMILGLVAGRWVRTASPRVPMKKFLIAGVAGLALGAVLHYTGINPIVKRIWTPAWTIFSGGACFLLLAAFSWVLDVKGKKQWGFPLVVIGMNSIAAYMIAHLFENFIESSLRINLGEGPFRIFGPGLEPLLMGMAVLLSYWLILFWMYRRKLFLRI